MKKLIEKAGLIPREDIPHIAIEFLLSPFFRLLVSSFLLRLLASSSLKLDRRRERREVKKSEQKNAATHENQRSITIETFKKNCRKSYSKCRNESSGSNNMMINSIRIE